MAHPDPMDMGPSGTQPQPDRPRGYNVPMPPLLPIKTDVHGQPIFEHWANVNENYTVRLNDNGSAFEVRELNDDDPTGMGRRFEGDWPKMYPMGPPSQQPDYHPLLEKWGLKILNAGGFINAVYPWENLVLGPYGRLHDAHWRNPNFDVNERIHPVLRFDMWRGITQADYQMMYWSLILASAVLDDPMVLNYFYPLMQPVASMDTVFDPDTNRICRIVDIPSTLTPDQQLATYQAMCSMRGYTHYDFSGEASQPPHCVLGSTNFNLDQNSNCIPAARPNTRQTTIRIDHGSLQLLRELTSLRAQRTQNTHNWFSDVQRMARIPAHKREHIDVDSVHARLTFTLANTILHEFVHAFIDAHFDQLMMLPPITHPLEPWLRGTRSNEQGHCFENLIWGSVPKALIIALPPISMECELRQAQSMPFGAHFDDIWDQWLVHVPDASAAVMPSVRADMLSQPRKSYPVLQEWFQRLFSDDMWMQQVMRFGIDVVKMPRPPMWESWHWTSYTRGLYGTGEERWNRPDDTDWVRQLPCWM